MDPVKSIQSTGLKRNIIDKYYTKSNIADKLIELVKERIKISKTDLIIEPSAGNGSFFGIKTLGANYRLYDLEPEHDEIIKQDFLELDCDKLKKDYKKIHIIGNPPFGRQASLAIKFIKKCSVFNSISFILPKSFKKDSMKKYFPLNFHLIYELDLDDNAFLINNEECNVPCIFQIWIYKKHERVAIKKIEPVNFKFVKKNSNPDISFRRVGVNAGTISTDISSKSFQSHYFIKFTKNTIEENIDKLKAIKFDTDNTVGPRSISKPELIREFNKYI